MSPDAMTSASLQRVCLNQPEAMDFLQRWVNYVHAIDDIVDEATTAEFKVGAFVLALELFNHPFYLQHRATLNPVILLVTNLYADSVRWEQSTVDWQERFAEHARHGAGELVLAVAGIVGGYAHMRSVSEELRAVNYARDHAERKLT